MPERPYGEGPIIREFLRLEAAGGILLILAAAIALIVANSPLHSIYEAFLEIPVAIQFSELKIDKPLHLWINDGMMAIFFFLVGLEIKREFLEGELSTPSQLALPALAAVGGMIVPALIFIALNRNDPSNLSGWAIPTATDIAFALGILALVGSRAPLALKVLLTAIAIIDDLGAIVIIAVFYTSSISTMALVGAAICIASLILINRLGVARPAIYILIGLVLWVFVLKSGIHATLAGVVTALTIPLRSRTGMGPSMLKDMEHFLHPWVAFVILPLFAFTNAGVSFAGMGITNFIEPVKMGIALGLFAGKQIGVFSVLWLAIKFKISPMPKDTTWRQLYAVALLCGIGFTMSLFIGTLAYDHSDFAAPIRLGVLSGSIFSATCGYLLLRYGTGPKRGAAA